MIGPAIPIHMNGLLSNHFLFHESLTASNCCLVSARSAFHLFWLYHWWHDLFWFHGRLFIGLVTRLLNALGLLLRCLLSGLLHLLLFGWRFLCHSRSALAGRFFDNCLLHWFRCFLLHSGYLLLLHWGSRLWNRRLHFLSGRSPFLHWRFSLPHGRLQSPFILETLDYFLECESWLFKIYFKFNSILIRNLNFFLKPVLPFFFELSNVRCGVDINTAQIVLLIGLFFIELKGEGGFSIGVEVGYVEVKLAAPERHDMRAIWVDEICIGHDLVFIKLLHAYIFY